MSTYTRLNLGAIPADTAVHTKCRNCTGRVLVPRVTLSCNKRARDQKKTGSGNENTPDAHWSNAQLGINEIGAGNFNMIFSRFDFRLIGQDLGHWK